MQLTASCKKDRWLLLGSLRYPPPSFPLRVHACVISALPPACGSHAAWGRCWRRTWCAGPAGWTARCRSCSGGARTGAAPPRRLHRSASGTARYAPWTHHTNARMRHRRRAARTSARAEREGGVAAGWRCSGLPGPIPPVVLPLDPCTVLRGLSSCPSLPGSLSR